MGCTYSWTSSSTPWPRPCWRSHSVPTIQPGGCISPVLLLHGLQQLVVPHTGSHVCPVRSSTHRSTWNSAQRRERRAPGPQHGGPSRGQRHELVGQEHCPLVELRCDPNREAWLILGHSYMVHLLSRAVPCSTQGLLAGVHERLECWRSAGAGRHTW